MDRPVLNEISLEHVKNAFISGMPSENIPIFPMNQGQWNLMLQAVYDQGINLLELDDNNRAVRAYRRKLGT